ncbi:hemagglutinin repeat-containing protein [Snodgrassella communis]|uniref:hemagglutinin repeat-containing protein n=1 Tax=Snodgrassella communis TaxID=2946699 RepID=UPI001EF726B7|nr:hemagglutinin repeat-containing protein [Snodgrassella communis]
MAAFNAGMDSYQAGQAIADAGNNPQSAAQNVSVSITVGQQKSRSESHSVDNIASASNIHAGGQVNLLATGAGQDSNINIIGSDISGNQGTHLQADNQINLLAAEQSHSERSKNSSSGWNAGVAINYGSGGASFGVTAGANRGKGHANGDETSYRNSHIGSLSGNTSLISGGATNIKGAQVTGKGVSIDAAELNIESLQDSAKYDSKQQNIGGQITVGYGVSGTANYSKSKIADYAGVTEQSGIIAGDNGYQIKVTGNTDLKGAIITSTQAAEAAGKNQLITGSLTSSDIKKHSDYKGSSIGIGASGNYGGGWTGQSKDGASSNIGYGSDSGHDSSTTHSGINTNNIIITYETAQQQKSGKSAAETIAGIHTDITSDNYADKAGYLANNFDKDKVQQELDLQREVSQEFSANIQATSAFINSKKDRLKEELKQENLSPEQRAQYEKELAQWNTGGLILNAIGAGLAAPTNSIGGILAATASPAISHQIGQYFKGKDAEGSTAHLVAHAVLGAAVAAAGGNNAVTGLITAAGTEAMAPVLSQWLYGKDAKDLTADEKATVSAIAGLTGAATGAAVGGSMADVAQGNQAGHTAVENNWGNNDWANFGTTPEQTRKQNNKLEDTLKNQYGKDAEKLVKDIESGKIPFNKMVADYLYTINKDPYLIVNLPENKVISIVLPKEAENSKWGQNPAVPTEEKWTGHVPYIHYDDWGVFGHVTVSRDKINKQKIRYIDDSYDFEMHNGWTSIPRNIETWIGSPGKGTSYKIHIKSKPNIIYDK